MPRAELKLNLSALDSLRREAVDAALETMTEVKGEVVTAHVVPRKVGTLEGSMGALDQKVDGDNIVTSLCVGDTAYARRLYFHPEYNFNYTHNENAQGLWLSPWLPGGANESFLLDTFHLRLRARLGK